jgi:hypothetical protein
VLHAACQWPCVVHTSKQREPCDEQQSFCRRPCAYMGKKSLQAEQAVKALSPVIGHSAETISHGWVLGRTCRCTIRHRLGGIARVACALVAVRHHLLGLWGSRSIVHTSGASLAWRSCADRGRGHVLRRLCLQLTQLLAGRKAVAAKVHEAICMHIVLVHHLISTYQRDTANS